MTPVNDRELLGRAYHDYEAAVKAARKLWPAAGEATLREAAADFLVHVRKLRRAELTPRPTVNGDLPPCPVCQGPMKDQRATKRGNQPDYKCTRPGCNGAAWLDRKPRTPAT